MSRTPAILSLLAALALVLVGAWWIGVEPEADPGADPVVEDVVPEDSIEATAAEDLADTALDPVNREVVAGPEASSADALGDAGAPAAARTGLRARGTLVDAITGMPLPEYTFELRDSGSGTARIVTDEKGAFVATELLSPGKLRARYFEFSRDFVDAAAELRGREDGEVEPLVLRVESGPTYRLAISPADAPAPSTLRGRLELRVTEGQSVARGDGREGTPPWIRFGPIPAGAQAEAQLVLDSRDGVWRGSTTVRVGNGIQPGVVSVVMRALSALAVQVVGEDGAPLANAVVAWKPASGQRGREQATDGEGRTSFDRLPVEPGTLVARSARYLDFELPTALLVGERRLETVRMLRRPSAGSIRGVVYSDTGTYAERVDMRLALADQRDGPRPLGTQVVWSTEGGAKVGRFAFDDLPPGRWRLSVGENDWYEWEPRRQDVEAPLDGVQFRVHDSVPVADLVFDPTDEVGARLLDFEVRIVGGGETRVERAWKPPLVLPAFPVQKSLRWRIDAPGRAAVFGDWDSLSPLVAVQGREQRGAKPVLARGWAQLYRVVRSDNKRPIENAQAMVDGREAGRTDAQGRVVLRADARPGKVVFRSKDWRMIDKVDTGPVRQGSNEFERTIRLEVPKNTKKKP